MNRKEQKTFKKLCAVMEITETDDCMEYATPEVLGYLFYNRMAGIAYQTLKNNNLMGRVNREFRNSLTGAYEINCEKNISFFASIKYLSKLLENCDFNYAMLKGAYLCRYYPEGCRTSNDIDLLVEPKDVTKIGEILSNAGFKQGNIRNGTFIPATRKEIIESKMLRGETVPYIKEILLPRMKYLEVDINFSLDYKNGSREILKDILSHTVIENVKGLPVRTLEKCDFFIHLCNHLYKEATTLPWVEMRRDMSLYKYYDIYLLLGGFDNKQIDEIFNRAKNLDMEKICAFTIIQTAKILSSNNNYALKSSEKVLASDRDFLHKVISPQNKKELIYTEKSIEKRFFNNNRRGLLREVDHSEKA